jgi:hypothetical protein
VGAMLRPACPTGGADWLRLLIVRDILGRSRPATQYFLFFPRTSKIPFIASPACSSASNLQNFQYFDMVHIPYVSPTVLMNKIF